METGRLGELIVERLSSEPVRVHRWEFEGGVERLKAINEGRDLNEMFYQMPVLVPCPECKGKGEILLFTQTHKCEKCDGKGKVTAAEAKDSES